MSNNKDNNFSGYFRRELNVLRGYGKQFSKKHPALAPMLGETSADPDSERLLEGVAFLNGLIRKKIDDDFPEVVLEIIDILFPHFIRPIPSLSIIQFEPKASLKESIVIKKGTYVNSIPVNDIGCKFQTTWDLNVYPVQLKYSEFERNNDNTCELRLHLKMNDVPYNAIDLQSLNFYINDTYSRSTSLAMLLSHHLTSIQVESDSFKGSLHSDSLDASGFDLDRSLFPFPSNAMRSYRLLQEYFVLPRKFLFFKLNNLNRFKNSIESYEFTVIFHCNKSYNLSSLGSDAIALNCVPVINIFEDEAEPVRLHHLDERIKVTSSYKDSDFYRVYDVTKVIGYEQGNVQTKEYMPFSKFNKLNKHNYVYQLLRKKSVVDSMSEECFLQLYYTNVPRVDETLSIYITSTNGKLPEHLELGDITVQSENSPELLEFKNITVPTMMIESPIEKESLWFLISHLTTNLLRLNNIATLKEILQYYINPYSRDRSAIAANRKRIESIDSFDVTSSKTIYRGNVINGSKIKLTTRHDAFASIGDMYIFMSVLHGFFSLYSSINTFVEFEVYEKITGETLRWPPRMGSRNLI